MPMILFRGVSMMTVRRRVCFGISGMMGVVVSSSFVESGDSGEFVRVGVLLQEYESVSGVTAMISSTFGMALRGVARQASLKPVN